MKRFNLKDILMILKKQSDTVNFNAVKISLLSPDKILSVSYGEIKKPETINYRTFKAERDGLFCAKIFGPTKNYECLCGKYKKLKHRGVVCEKCGVEVTLAKVRRSRMAHIILGTPVAHIWFLKSLPSKISMVLNLSLRNVEKILYFEEYIVSDPGMTLLEERQILNEENYVKALKEYGDEFKIKTGGDAIYELLENINLDIESQKIKQAMENTRSEIKFKKLLRRLKVVEAFMKTQNKPEWMMLTVLPVLPPDLRPLVPLDGGRFASSDLNDLYRRVINRNNRLKKLLDLNAPDIIVRNEKRMLQEAVDALLDNNKKGKPITGSNKRPLKSLADMIKGKYGRFRQNLLGKRVDYSGRSIIVVGPNLKLGQCGIPKKLALELFKPFIFAELHKRNLSTTIKRSKKMIEKESDEIWDVLEKVVYQHPVLLNRAPTLHRLGIQAFEVILIDSKAIQLHPLVCSAFNADFDGDQMAIHIPLTIESQLEAKILIMASNNILSPSNGEPVIVPSQDIILGLYYLSKTKNVLKSSKFYFKNEYDVEKAYENNLIGLNDLVNVKINSKLHKTTFGKIVLKRLIPPTIVFNSDNIITKKEISNLIALCYLELGPVKTVELADNLKEIGFYYATRSGISIGIDDIEIPNEKQHIIKLSVSNVKKIEDQYSLGLITKEERYNKIIDIWSKASETLTKELMKKISIKKVKDSSGKICIEESFNPIYMMAESGARGSTAQIRQLAGMRGLMAKPDGSIIETPIIANFKEGLNILQYFISAHGARKGLADTALKTANSGYLTRRLVDVSQDVVIVSNDCETDDYLILTSLIDGGNIIESLSKRIYGRIIHEDIYDNNSKLIIKKGTLLTKYVISIIEGLNIESVKVRSVIKCKFDKGVCAKCYGMDLSNGKLVNIGEAVGIIAAQSIGEPGTQLTMRTFHVGGAASKAHITNCVQIKTDGILEFKNIKLIKHSHSRKFISVARSGKINVLDLNGKEKEQHKIPYGAIINISDKTKVKNGDIIAQWDPHNYPVISEIDGVIKYVNLIEGVTIKKELDKITGLSNLKVIDNNKDKDFNDNTKPCIKIINKNSHTKEEKAISYFLSPGAVINFDNEEKINKGDIIAKIPKETLKTKDITGGLPRVADIFEARKPKNPAVLAPASGKIKFGKEKKGKKSIIIETDENTIYKIIMPRWRNPNVFENESILKGETIIEGEYDLHDILDILGINELTEYIKKHVQDIYRLQGVNIDEKHIEVIIRQMLKKAVILDAGDSHLLQKDTIHISLLKEINENLIKNKKKIVIYKQILLGITRAALTTESFISAASFQETTRILIEAAINEKKDNLLGLKENVIVGKLIPAGTGFFKKHV
ncbi:MAG TPA: DNA-directed RNA polymerase subunit beta' [Candidatus Azoamicus sp. OHIO2]